MKCDNNQSQPQFESSSILSLCQEAFGDIEFILSDQNGNIYHNDPNNLEEKEKNETTTEPTRR